MRAVAIALREAPPGETFSGGAPMPINVLRLRTMAANCRRFAAIARDHEARRFLIDLAREYEASAADVEVFDRDRRKLAEPILLTL